MTQTSADLSRREYKNPPIIEALCALQWSEPLPLGVAAPGVIFELLKDSYPAEPQVQAVLQPTSVPGIAVGVGVPPAQIAVEGQTASGSGGVTTTVTFPALPQRFVYFGVDRTRLVTVSPLEATAHSLAPYEGWDSLFNRFQTMVELLAGRFPLPNSSGASMRYINKLVLPVRDEEVEPLDWLTIAPLVPPHYPQDYARFANRTEHLYKDEGVTLTLTFSTGEPVVGQGLEIILDLDLRMIFDAPRPWDRALPSLVGMKRIEGEAFEALLKDSLRERFNE